MLSTLELAARLNKEIGLGSEDRPPGVRIVIKTNLRVGALRNGRKVLNGNGHAN